MPRQISGLKWQDSWEPLFQGQINGLKSLHVAFISVPSAQYFVPTDAHLSTSRDSVVHVLRERQ